jgi:predicted DNA-binding transcriptional regulator AlpA
MNTLLSNCEAAAFLGVSPDTLPRWRWSGIGPSYLKIGRSVKYRLSDLEAYLAGRRVEIKGQDLSVKVG